MPILPGLYSRSGSVETIITIDLAILDLQGKEGYEADEQGSNSEDDQFQDDSNSPQDGSILSDPHQSQLVWREEYQKPLFATMYTGSALVEFVKYLPEYFDPYLSAEDDIPT